MKIKIETKETPIQEFVKMLYKYGEIWAEVPWNIPQLRITYSAILRFGVDEKGFYFYSDSKGKVYLDIYKIPSVHLVTITEETNED